MWWFVNQNYPVSCYDLIEFCIFEVQDFANYETFGNWFVVG